MTNKPLTKLEQFYLKKQWNKMKSNKVMNIYELISKNQSYKITKHIEIDYPLEYKSGKENRREKRALERKLKKINGKKRSYCKIN